MINNPSDLLCFALLVDMTIIFCKDFSSINLHAIRIFLCKAKFDEAKIKHTISNKKKKLDDDDDDLFIYFNGGDDDDDEDEDDAIFFLLLIMMIMMMINSTNEGL
jgi:hypothetical protein